MNLHAPQTNSEREWILCIPEEYVPFYRMFWQMMQWPSHWATTTDWNIGYAAFAAQEAGLMPLQDLIKEIRALRGLKPENAAIPEAERTIDMYSSVQMAVDAIKASQGVLTSGWFGEVQTPATLADIVRSGQGSEKAAGTNALQMLKDLLSVGSSAATIANFVEGLLADGTDTVVDAGIGVATIAILSAIAGQLSALSLQIATLETSNGDIERLIRLLDNVYNGTFYEGEWESNQSLRLDVRDIRDSVE